MAKKLLIDANHPEEIRVAVVNGPLLEEFDSETSTKKQIKGNIYLAKVVRVEPSLQAAFVDFGGNRHGFLSFSEIHPDYYRIPVADREAALKTVQSETLKEHLDGSEQFSLEADIEENSSDIPSEPTEEQLLENVLAIHTSIEKNKPSGVKGRYFKSFNICTTMSPSLKIDLSTFKG